MRSVGTHARVLLAGVLVLVLVVGVSLAFVAGHGEDEPRPDPDLVGGQETETAKPDTPAALPQRATPPTPFPGAPWYVPYLEEEARASRFDDDLNGIRIGPSVTPQSPCAPGEARAVSEEAAVGTPLEIQPAYLPPGSIPIGSDASMCRDQVIGTVREYTIPAASPASRFGGHLLVVRSAGSHEVSLNEAADRASAVTIAGRPAVAFRPLTPEGWGPSALVVAEPWGITRLQATGLPAHELQRIAEGLYW